VASHDSLPHHTHGSVPGWWLTFTRAGLSGLPALALLGALMLYLSIKRKIPQPINAL
jgi:hypothetical protein